MIPLMKSAFSHEDETKKALAEFIISTNKLSMGDKCQEFEKEFALFHKRKDAVLFNSGGSSNLAMLQALKNVGRIKDGAKIAFSSLTWSTNVMPIIQLGMIPVALDCEVNTINVMSKNLLERLDDTDIDVFFVTNVLGFAGDLFKIREICHERNIILIEDNCESLGSSLNNCLTGNFGLMSSCSFFVAHHMSTIEGGMVLTDDEELGEMLRIVRANGWDRNLSPEQQNKWRNKYKIESEFQAKYTFYDLGFNLRPTEITGFIGLYQLKFLEETINKREENYLKLVSISKNNEEIITIEHSNLSKLSNFAFPVVCKNPDLRKKYLKRFHDANVELRPMISRNIQTQPFYTKYVNKLYNLPNTEFIDESGFYFGNYPELSTDDINILSDCLKGD